MNGIVLTTPALYCRRDMQEPELHAFAGGLAVAFSARSPGKETPNEDAAALIPIDEHSGVLLVADGLGGSRSGELASETVVAALKSSLEACAVENGSLRTGILDGIEAGNRQLCEMGVGAATTLSVVEMRQRKASDGRPPKKGTDGHRAKRGPLVQVVRPFHIGDTEILIVGGRGKVKLQTVSHSPVGFAVESGLLEAADAMHHEERHLVSNVVGTPEMRIEIGAEITLAPRDTLLIASDGLFDNLHLDEIVEVIRRGRIEQSVARLADMARNRMTAPSPDHPSKPDDLTMIAFRPQPPSGGSSTQPLR